MVNVLLSGGLDSATSVLPKSAAETHSQSLHPGPLLGFSRLTLISLKEGQGSWSCPLAWLCFGLRRDSLPPTLGYNS